MTEALEDMGHESSEHVLPAQQAAWKAYLQESERSKLNPHLLRLDEAVELRLPSWGIGPSQGATASHMMANLASLTTIDLSDCRLDHAAVKRVCEAVQDSAVLANLNLSCNPAGSDAASAISGLIKQSRTIRTLMLNQMRLGNLGGTRIAEGLLKNHTLEWLHLSRREPSFIAPLHM